MIRPSTVLCCIFYTIQALYNVHSTLYTVQALYNVHSKNVIQKHVTRSLRPGGNGPMAGAAAMAYLDRRNIAAMPYSYGLRSMTAMESTGCQRILLMKLPQQLPQQKLCKGRVGFKTSFTTPNLRQTLYS